MFPVALASVAVAFTGINRATAIGLAYAAYSVGQALMPVLLDAPARLLRARASSPRSSRPPSPCGSPGATRSTCPGPTRAERPYVVGTVLWASGVVSLATGILWLGGGLNPIRIGMIVLGIALVGRVRARRAPAPRADDPRRSASSAGR